MPDSSISDDAGPRSPKIALYRQILQFFAYLSEQFLADDCPRTAASLAYTTLLALVPLLAVVFVSLSAFPAFREMGDQMEIFIFKNFVPAMDDTIRNYLGEFAHKASSLRTIGLVVLIVTVLALMGTIENAFNAIWRVRIKRRRIVNMLVYWAVLTLGPLLIGTGLAVSSYLASLPLFSEVDAEFGIERRLLGAMPFFTSFLAFTLIYKIIPNREVPLAHAATGGLTASVLFELAKRGFGYYIRNFPTHEAIYGAFAAIPIFLIWVYLSWVIVLLGAEISRCLMTFPAESSVRRRGGFDSIFFDALVIVSRFAEAQIAGRSLSERKLLKLEPHIRSRRLDQVLEQLALARWIARTDVGEWALLRDLYAVSLWDLYCIVPGAMPTRDDQTPAAGARGTELWRWLNERTGRFEDCMQIKLSEIITSGR